MSAKFIPCLVVGGYLGAGKTTLINDFLRDPKGLRATVLVNDFGKINIDADLIQNAKGDTIALTNGCACCSIGDDLLAAASQALKSDPPPDVVIVEASGVSHPARIAMLLLGVANLAAARCLTVIDASRARANAKDKFIAGLFQSQIDAAHLVSVNRGEQVSDAAFLDGVLTKHAADLPRVGDLTSALFAPDPDKSLSMAAAHGGEPNHELAFQTRIFKVPAVSTFETLEHWAQALPANVQRAKGIVSVTGRDGMARMVELSHTGNAYTLRDIPGAPPNTLGQIVVIGLGSLATIPELGPLIEHPTATQ